MCSVITNADHLRHLLSAGKEHTGWFGAERVRVDCQWDHSPFPFLFTLFFPFTRAEFMRPLRMCVQCQQCPANIFIQHREEWEGGGCQAAHTLPRRQTALPTRTRAQHARTHLRHLTGLSISNTLAPVRWWIQHKKIFLIWIGIETLWRALTIKISALDLPTNKHIEINSL